MKIYKLELQAVSEVIVIWKKILIVTLLAVGIGTIFANLSNTSESLEKKVVASIEPTLLVGNSTGQVNLLSCPTDFVIGTATCQGPLAQNSVLHTCEVDAANKCDNTCPTVAPTPSEMSFCNTYCSNGSSCTGYVTVEIASGGDCSLNISHTYNSGTGQYSCSAKELEEKWCRCAI